MTRFASSLLLLFGVCLALVPASPPAAQEWDVLQGSSLLITRDQPLDVGVGIKIEQITSVDQKSENFGAVATIRVTWNDPLLSFDPDETGRDYRFFKPSEFHSYAEERATIVPAFVIQNQQSNRWIHESILALGADGTAAYAEKSSLILQAPYFDFRRYPFDKQDFFFEVVSTLPEHLVRYSPLEEFSGLGDLLGEEEWILTNASIDIDSVVGLSGRDSARAVLSFEGTRHVLYYLTRIFLPLLVLVTVSWAVFFLDDYRKRAEVAGANLLIFVAFNWMISSELPRLGYLTFVDFILQLMFVVTGAIVIFNTVLSYLQLHGREALAATLDRTVVRWVYPISYAAIVAYAVNQFLWSS